MYAGVMRKMAQGYRTTVETMQAAANHTQQVNQDVQAELKSLMAKIMPITSGFKGNAATSFIQLQQRWDEAATRLNNALADIAEGIRQNSTTYQTSDESVSESFRGIGGALG
ncbi:MAG: WXG100 family type VII secretion target [Streptosporangiales bacterium]|nr:WXG100 family type VII secretion target [Streptosporangiales bacterium]